MQVLVVDIGGNNVKLSLYGGPKETIKVPSGPGFTTEQFAKNVPLAIKDWAYDVVSVGFPAPVKQGRLVRDPVNLGPGWTTFDFAGVLGKEVRMLNDAAMQALGSYQGGRMMFLGLGTGLGTALVTEQGEVIGMELGHLPYKKGESFEEYVGHEGFESLGKKQWNAVVLDILERFRDAFVVDEFVLGGGNAKKLTDLPNYARLGDNKLAILGGARLWIPDAKADR